MKVLFLRTDFYGHTKVGGSFSHTKGFLQGLRSLGHECVVASSGDLPLDDGVACYHVPYSDIFRNLPEVLSIAYNWRVIKKGAEIIRTERPNFIYHRHSEFNFSSSILARRFGMPLVLEFNGSEVWVKKHWGQVYLGGILQRAEQLQIHSADLISVVSSVVKDELLKLGIHDRRIIVNPNGVDPNFFHPTVDGSAVIGRYGLRDKVVVGFVGTFGAWHGIDVLARAVKPTVAKVPRVHFLVIGEGTLRAELERILREDQVEDYVTLTGTVPHAEVPSHLAACSILVSPHVQNVDGSEFFGSPTKLFEYMAMGKPIIASGIGQIGEIITDGVNGLLMKHRDHLDMAEKIRILTEDADLRKRLGAASRKDAVEKFSWKRNAERVLEGVQNLMKKKPS